MAEQTQGVKTSFFRQLKGNRNAFAMLLFEPMWGIPYNLFISYFPLYMSALGCTPQQIGLISTVGMICQMLFALVAPIITDRLGRNRTTLIFDMISWPVVTLVWIFSRNFWFFLIAAVIQSTNRVVHVSWTCLLVEDTDKHLLVRLFSWFTIAGLLSAVFAPAAAGLVKALTVVPAMQWMLAGSFVMMTVMFLTRNAFTRETAVGRARMEQSRKEPFLAQAAAVVTVSRDIWRNKNILFFFILTALYNAALIVKAPFFVLLITGELNFTDESAGYFAAAASAVMLAVYLFVQPVLSRFRPRLPLTAGLLLCAVGSLALLPSFGSGTANLAAILASVVLNAVGASVAQPFIEGLSHGSINNEKRSNMTSILLALTMLTSAPFGWFGGWLYHINARLPFLAGFVLYLACAGMMTFFYKNQRYQAAQNPAESNTTKAQTAQSQTAQS